MSARTLAAHVDPAALRGDRGTLYTALADELDRLISAGTLAPRVRVPSERVFAAVLGISRVTVASAYRELRDRGRLVSRHGSGTFVVPEPRPLPWGGLLHGNPGDVLEFVNAAPPASTHLGAAYATAAREIGAHLTDTGYVRAGVPTLRELVAQRFSRRGMPTTPDQILVTSGAADALHAVVDTFVDPGNRVLIEHPTYPGAVEVIEAAGGRCVSVPVDPADPDAFVAGVDRLARQHDPTLAYLMPDWSNPSGAELPTAHRRRVAATLHRHGVLTVVDEVAVDLALDGDQPSEAFGAPLPDRATITVGSMSKTVWGGLRVGWVRADPAHIARLASTFARRQLGVSALDQFAAIDLLGRYDEVVAHRAARLAASRDRLMDGLTRRLPNWTFHRPRGGLSLWCTLPDGLGSTALVEAARGHGLLLAPGTRFGTGYAFDDHQRIPFTRSPAEIDAALDVLVRVCGDGADLARTPAAPRRVEVPELIA